MKNLAPILAFFAAAPALGYYPPPWWPHDPRCQPQTTQRLISQDTTVTGGCGQTETLQLGRTSHSYPAMGGLTLEVEYWEGSYGYPTHTHSVYENDVYDCYGQLQNSFQSTDESDSVVEFSVDNPNLHDDVAISFVATAPLTDPEARAALAASSQACTTALSKISH